MAIAIKADASVIVKAVVLVCSVITLGLAASCYEPSFSKETYFLAAACLSMIFTVLLFIFVLLIEGGSISVGGVTAKQVDTIGHGLAGILLVIGSITFAVSVADWWWVPYKKGERATACFFGFLTSLIHFGVAGLAGRK